jgi:hypothetical protein
MQILDETASSIDEAVCIDTQHWTVKDGRMQDADVLRSVRKSLDDIGYSDLKGVRLSIEEEETTVEDVNVKFLVLRGTVGSFFMKQMAQVCIIEQINGYHVRNLIDVIPRKNS